MAVISFSREEALPVLDMVVKQNIELVVALNAGLYIAPAKKSGEAPVAYASGYHPIKNPDWPDRARNVLGETTMHESIPCQSALAQHLSNPMWTLFRIHINPGDIQLSFVY